MSESIVSKHKVNWDKQRLRYDHETYRWEAEGREQDWFRISKSNPKQSYLVNRYDRGKGKKKSGRLDGVLRRAIEERTEQNYKNITLIEAARHPISDSADESDKGESEEHHHRDKAKVDLNQKMLTVGSKRYRWVSQHWSRLDYEYDDDWYRVHRNGEEDKIQDIRSIQKLERLRKDAEPLKVHQKEESKPAEKKTPWQRHTKGGPPAKGQRIERTKYGVRVWTLDGKTYWDVCVNNSSKYPGNAAIRVTLPPPRRDGNKFQMGIFDLEAMEAIRREIDRGPNPKK